MVVLQEECPRGATHRSSKKCEYVYVCRLCIACVAAVGRGIENNGDDRGCGTFCSQSRRGMCNSRRVNSWVLEMAFRRGLRKELEILD